MLDWQGDATVLARRKHGETAVILTVFARDAGVVNGVVPGGAGARRGPMLQPGNRLSLRWRARLADQLGTFIAEPLASRAGLMDDPATLAGLNAVTALLAYALPERDPHPHLWDRTEDLLDAMQAGGDWAGRYLRWELTLLDELGFGLVLDRCAVTGATEGLAYVSPRTGHAVSAAGAGEWAPRLLPLPALLGGPDSGPDSGSVHDPDSGSAHGSVDGSGSRFAQALAVTGHFLNANLAEAQIGRPLPAARDRLVRRLSQRNATPGPSAHGSSGA